MSASARAFVALALAPELAQRLAATVAGVLDAAAYRLATPEALHLTLAFLGSVERTALATFVPRLVAAIGALPPPRLRLSGTGAFPGSRRARVLWCGLAEDCPGRLAAARSAVLEALAAAGISLRSEEPFHPHVTVARARRSPGPIPPSFAALRWELPWPIGEACLMESLAEGERRYEVLARAPFAEVR